MDRVIGFLRFSVVTQSHKHGYRSTRDQTVEQAVQTILSPQRIAQRLELLQLMPLASLARQTDRNFEIELVTSTLMPPHVKVVLRELESKHAFLRVSELDLDDSVGDHFASCMRAGERMISFRIDDDDALNPNHIADLRALAAGKDERVLTTPNGLYVQPVGDKLAVQHVRYPNNAFGIGYISSSGKSIWNAGKHSELKVDMMEQGLRPNAWIRSTHAGSDSGARIYDGEDFTLHTPEAIKGLYPDYDFIDFENLHRLLGPVALVKPPRPSLKAQARRLMVRLGL